MGYQSDRWLRKCGDEVMHGTLCHHSLLKWSNGEVWQFTTGTRCKFPEDCRRSSWDLDELIAAVRRPRVEVLRQSLFRTALQHPLGGFEGLRPIHNHEHSLEDSLAFVFRLRSCGPDNDTEQKAKALGVDVSTYRKLKELKKRDISPEDYDLLGKLDEGKAKPKLSQEKLQRFPVQTYGTLIAADVNECSLCRTAFRLDEEVRNLQCCKRAVFHCECIDPWLLESSDACPLCKAALA